MIEACQYCSANAWAMIKKICGDNQEQLKFHYNVLALNFKFLQQYLQDYPQIAGQPINLFTLFNQVTNAGGFFTVFSLKRTQGAFHVSEVKQQFQMNLFNLPEQHAKRLQIEIYCKYLLLWEQFVLGGAKVSPKLLLIIKQFNHQDTQLPKSRLNQLQDFSSTLPQPVKKEAKFIFQQEHFYQNSLLGGQSIIPAQQVPIEDGVLPEKVRFLQNCQFKKCSLDDFQQRNENLKLLLKIKEIFEPKYQEFVDQKLLRFYSDLGSDFEQEIILFLQIFQKFDLTQFKIDGFMPLSTDSPQLIAEKFRLVAFWLQKDVKKCFLLRKMPFPNQLGSFLFSSFENSWDFQCGLLILKCFLLFDEGIDAEAFGLLQDLVSQGKGNQFEKDVAEILKEVTKGEMYE